MDVSEICANQRITSLNRVAEHDEHVWIGDNKGYLSVWDPRAAHLQHQLHLEEYHKIITSLSSSNNAMLLCAQHQAFMLDLRKLVLSQPMVHSLESIQCSATLQQNIFACTSGDGKVIIVDSLHLNQVHKIIDLTIKSLFTSIEPFGTDSVVVAVLGKKGGVLVYRDDHNADNNEHNYSTTSSWDTVSLTHTLMKMTEETMPLDLSVSSDFKWLTVALSDARVAFFNSRDLEIPPIYVYGHRALVSHVEFASFDPNILVSAGGDKELVLWGLNRFGVDNQDVEPSVNARLKEGEREFFDAELMLHRIALRSIPDAICTTPSGRVLVAHSRGDIGITQYTIRAD